LKPSEVANFTNYSQVLAHLASLTTSEERVFLSYLQIIL